MNRHLRICILTLLAACVFCSAAVCVTPSPPAYALAEGYVPSPSYEGSAYYQRLCAIELTGDRRTDIAAVALSQVGYHEGGGENDLSGGSRSSGNATEYGRAFGQTQDSWCAMFIWWCAYQCGIPESVVARTAWAKRQTFGCPSVEFADASPQPGDIAFIDNDGDGIENHVGLIVSVDEKKIHTVEGNCSDKVSEMQYDRAVGTSSGAARIVFVGSPPYEEAGVDSRTVTYARIISSGAVARKRSNRLAAVMARPAKGEEHRLIHADKNWYQLEFGLNGYWVSASECELFAVIESGGTTAPPVQTTAPPVQTTQVTQVTQVTQAEQAAQTTTRTTAASVTAAPPQIVTVTVTQTAETTAAPAGQPIVTVAPNDPGLEPSAEGSGEVSIAAEESASLSVETIPTVPSDPFDPTDSGLQFYHDDSSSFGLSGQTKSVAVLILAAAGCAALGMIFAIISLVDRKHRKL